MVVSSPYFPPINPYTMPEAPFDGVIKAYGVRLAWMRSHTCPCTFSGTIIGSPNPQCVTCQGRGVYWDPPSNPFFGYLSFIHISRTPDEPGFFTNEKVGIVQHGQPTLSIPYAADSTGTIWSEATLYDAFVEIDAFTRFNTNLYVGGITAVPYQQGLSIALSGAVTVYDTTTNSVVSVSGYTVSGANVMLPDNYPENTPYNVEYTANNIYIAFGKAGALPHIRPFGGNIPNYLPRRFTCQALDLWTRARQYPGSTSPQANPNIL